MRFSRYINENNNVMGFVYLSGELNEVSDELLTKIQRLGRKMGLRVTKSKTFQSNIKSAGVGVLHLMKLIIDYSIHADVMDKDARVKLEQDIKSQFSKVNREDVVSFIVNMDKSFLGITSIPRHVIQNILGINISTYDDWKSNAEYVAGLMKSAINTLVIMKDEGDIKLAKQIYKNVSGGDV